MKIPVISIPSGTFASGQTANVSKYTQGKITPMFRTLYANAEYGDITLTKPEDFLAKTSVVFIEQHTFRGIILDLTTRVARFSCNHVDNVPQVSFVTFRHASSALGHRNQIYGTEVS